MLNKRMVVASLLVCTLGAIALIAQGPQSGQEKLEQARSGQAKAGGRPGQFRFYTNDQLTADASRRVQLRLKLADLKKDMGSLAKNDKAKQRFLTEIADFENYVTMTESREKESAGPTARRVEAILNDKKGNTECSACHDADDAHQRPTRGSREGSSREGRR